MGEYNSDKRRGDINEDKTVDWYKPLGFVKQEKPEGKFEKYDWRLIGPFSFTFESKTDDWAGRTKRVAIEFEKKECTAKGLTGRIIPSGITVSEADQWVYHVDGKMYMCRLAHLRREMSKLTMEVAWLGNGKRSHCHYMKWPDFTRIFKLMAQHD